MENPGISLRQERERQGLALDQVAAATRVGRHHLEALERGDLGSLPPGAFARGFIRLYAEYLEMDPGPLVQAYIADTAPAGGGQEMLEEMSRLADRRKSDRSGVSRDGLTTWIVGAGAGLALLLFAGWLVIGLGGDADPAARPADGAPQPAPRTADVVREPATAAPPDGAPARDASAEPPAPPAGGANATDPPRPEASDPPTPLSSARPPSTSSAPSTPSATASTNPATDAPRSGAGPTRTPRTERAVQSEPARTPAATPSPLPSSLEIPEAGVGGDVQSRRLVGVSDRFPSGSRVFFWNRVVGGRKGDRLQHVWLHEGRQVAVVDLDIGGKHWRTWSRKTLHPGSAGNWAVEARDSRGRVLSRATFTCLP